jgi:glycosyltransferase involved in cell wall biosynthesis
MKRALIVSYYWPPSGGAGVQRWVKLSRYFARQGVKSWVVTVDPAKASYALVDKTLEQDVDPSVTVIHTSTREPYGIYKTLTRKKEIPFGGFANEEKQQLKFSQKLARFIRGNLFLPDARVGWNSFAYRACCELIEKEKIDAVITTSPPHSTQLVGLKLKKKYGLPWLADLRDPWTDIYYYDKLLLTDFSRRRDAKMERSVLEAADAVVSVSEDIRRSFIAKSGGGDSSKFHVIPNGFDQQDFELVRPEEKAEGFVISYTGTLTADYRLGGFLQAVTARLEKQEPLQLHITGSMPLSIKEKIETTVRGRVRFRHHVAHHEAIGQMKAADLLLLVIPDAKGNKGILTGKLFEYLAARRPILCIGPVDGDAASIIRDCRAGEVFDYDDAPGISGFLERTLENWKKGNPAVSDNERIGRFSREEQARQVIRLLSSIGK